MCRSFCWSWEKERSHLIIFTFDKIRAGFLPAALWISQSCGNVFEYLLLEQKTLTLTSSYCISYMCLSLCHKWKLVTQNIIDKNNRFKFRIIHTSIICHTVMCQTLELWSFVLDYDSITGILPVIVKLKVIIRGEALRSQSKFPITTTQIPRK